MGKTSSSVKERYNRKAYDRLAITVPKGRRDDIEYHAIMQGYSINGFVNRLIQDALDYNDSQWKNKQNL